MADRTKAVHKTKQKLDSLKLGSGCLGQELFQLLHCPAFVATHVGGYFLDGRLDGALDDEVVHGHASTLAHSSNTTDGLKGGWAGKESQLPGRHWPSGWRARGISDGWPGSG